MKLGERLAASGIGAVYSSPLARAMETARPLACQFGLTVEPRSALDEIDFGEWTGRALDDLDDVPEWRRFNSFRSVTRPPEGELMLEAQSRIVAEFTDWVRKYPERTIAAVTHADLIRAALCHYLCIPLDCCLRFEISPASITVLKLSPDWTQVVRVNETVE